MKLFTFLLLCLPASLLAEPVVLVDAIPSDATYLGSSAVGLPFRDAESQELKFIETGLSEAVSEILRIAREQDFTYVCLLSVPGEDPLEISIPKSATKLKLRRRNTAVTIVYYQSGTVATPPIRFSAGKIEGGRPHVSMQIDNTSMLAGSTPADWIYLNLPRIQSEAAKAAPPFVMLHVTGEAPTIEVVVPGMKEPLEVPKGKATFTASWYRDRAPAAIARE